MQGSLSGYIAFYPQCRAAAMRKAVCSKGDPFSQNEVFVNAGGPPLLRTIHYEMWMMDFSTLLPIFCTRRQLLLSLSEIQRRSSVR